jgi:hypothetical protein
MANRTSYPFTMSSQHRSDLGVALAPGNAVVATLLVPPRAQETPEERTTLGSGAVRHQWGLGIGPDPCNKLYVMHRAVESDFSLAELAIQFKSNPGQSRSEQCHNRGYEPATIVYTGADLGVIVVSRSSDGAMLAVKGYDLYGAVVLTQVFTAPVPGHWNGDCAISLRGDNCLAGGVITH